VDDNEKNADDFGMLSKNRSGCQNGLSPDGTVPAIPSRPKRSVAVTHGTPTPTVLITVFDGLYIADNRGRR